VVERALILSHDGTLDGQHLLLEAAALSDPLKDSAASLPANATLEAVERAHIQSVLARSGWRIEGERGAAVQLGINPSTLRGRMRKLGIRKTY
jgi:DNA-binding NtrC family response regulator